MSDVSGVPNLGIPGMGGGPQFADPFAATNAAVAANQANMLANYNANLAYVGAQNQASLNNAYGPQGFGGQTAYYAGLGAAYGRNTGYYGDTLGLSPGETTPAAQAAGNVFNTGAVTSYDPNAPFGGGYVGASSTMGTSSGDFNTSGYYNANPDALAAFRSNTTYDDPTVFAEHHLKDAYNSPSDHSIRTGWETTANPDFNAQGYYQANPDAWQAFAGSDSLDPTAFAEQHLKDAYNNPADSSIRGGWGADNSDFNAQGYYQANPDAWQAFAGSSATDPTAFAEQHLKDAYNNPGDRSIRGGWSPANSDFDAAGYYQANPDAWQAFVNGGWGANANDPTAFAETHLMAAHQNEGGNWRSGWQPSNSDFDTQGYFNANPDAADWFGTGTTGYTDPTKFAEYHLQAAHQAEGGMRGGWADNPANFDTAGYFAANPDALDWFGTGNTGYTDPTKFAEYHLGAAHAAEGGGWRGGWELASNDPNSLSGLGYSPEGWTSPYASFGSKGLSPTGDIANNPYAPPPGADISNPSSYWYPSSGEPNAWEVSRAPYTTQLAQDPDQMYKMAARLYLELGNDSTGRQAIAEAMFNRNAATGADPLDPNYFPHGPNNQKYLNDYANALATLKDNPQLLGQIYSEIGQAAAGSNISNGATDWASADTAAESAKYTTSTYKSPVEGESFFRKDLDNSVTGTPTAKKVQDWYNNIMNWQPQ